MPRHYMQQTETPATTEAEALVASTPIVIEGPNGMRGEEQTCGRHGTKFLLIRIPRLPVPVGQCPDCQAEE